MDHAPPWWAELYDDAVADLLLARGDAAEVSATVGYLWRTLELVPGARVFDQCCGIGSLAVPLLQRGALVVGVDLSRRYVARAQEAAAAAGVQGRFVAGDGFAFVPEEPCDAAFNWGTGFGNAASDAENLRMLRRAWESLRPGGRFVLDYQHIARVLMDFQPSIVRRGVRRGGSGQPDPAGAPGLLLLRESRLDLMRGVLAQRWTIIGGGRDGAGRREVTSEVRLYLPHELARLLGEAGFCDITFHGDLDGGPLLPQSPRCLAVARRPR